MATIVSNRRSSFGISCVRCNEELIAPDQSEYCAGTHIRHLWHCPSCSARFESIVGDNDGRYLSVVARRAVQWGRAHR